MRLTQPFRGWQLAFVMIVIVISPAASAQMLDSTTRVQALESSDFPRSVALVGELPSGLSERDWDAGITTSTSAWNDVACSQAELTWAGRFDAIADLPDNTTPIAFVDSDSERCFAIPSDIGWTLTTPCDDWPATTILLNASGFVWSASPAPYQQSGDRIVDLSSVLTHEFGHVLGLHHDDDPDDNGITDPLASMAPNYLLDGGLATLAAQDKLALCALHGSVSSLECQADRDCASGSCVSGGEWKVCEEPRVEVGDYCDIADLNCDTGSGETGLLQSRCLVTSAATYSGYCTAVCDEDAACPTDMFCDDETNECRYIVTLAAEPGCSTATAAASHGGWAIVGVVFLGGASWRRRRRATTRSL